jgi:prolyl-tRNA synthetase
LLVDRALEGRKNLISGANKEDYHLKNVTPGHNFQPTAYADLRSVTAGEACPNCGAALRIDTAVEVGHIFKLGYKYSESMGARVLDRNGKEVAPIMGCYGIGIERILTAPVDCTVRDCCLSDQHQGRHPTENCCRHRNSPGIRGI